MPLEHVQGHLIAPLFEGEAAEYVPWSILKIPRYRTSLLLLGILVTR